MKASKHDIEKAFPLPLNLFRASIRNISVSKVKKSRHEIEVTFPLQVGLLKAPIMGCLFKT